MPHSQGDKTTSKEVFRLIQLRGEEGITAEELLNTGTFNSIESVRCWLSRQKGRGYLKRKPDTTYESSYNRSTGRKIGIYYINPDTDWAETYMRRTA